jgi:hypothetical protein
MKIFELSVRYLVTDSNNSAKTIPHFVEGIHHTRIVDTIDAGLG